MTNPFSEAQSFFSNAFAQQEQAADQQANYQRSVDTPQRYKFFPTSSNKNETNSFVYDPEIFMENFKRELLNKSVLKLSEPETVAPPVTIRAGGGTPIPSVNNY